MVDNRTNFAKDISFILRRDYGDKLRIFQTEIPLSIRAAETSAKGKSIYAHDPTGNSWPKPMKPLQRRCRTLAKNDVRNSIKLTSVDDLFTTEESRAEQQREKVMDIPLSEISDFPNHPFKVKADEAMLEMADSVKQYGVLVPGLVRPKADGGYEMVAGHRRKKASELAGKETMPCIVREMDDDAATIIMVDSNLQRESIAPSEKAFAYKMKLEAMKRQAGPSKEDNYYQVGNNDKTSSK
jgi:hypothetical protein